MKLTGELTGKDLFVESPDWGPIYVRNKHPTGVDEFAPGRIVIMQHGATYGSAAFDLPFAGLSWMDYIASRGFDVYCIDLPGYGRSQRPPQMSEPAENSPPFMRTPDAAKCIGTVVDFVCDRRGVDRLCLLGWSWGTAITSYYAAERRDRVERLALYAPVWDRTESGPSAIHVDGPLGAYRTVDRAATIKRRQNGLTPEQATQVMPLEWFDMWWEATSSTDPGAAPGTIRAPNGVIQDSREYWNVGKPLYDPSKIMAPVLVIVGEWDLDTKPDMAIKLYPLFVNAPWKRLEIISGGTHSLMMEANRMLLFRSVQQFLEEPPPGVEATR